MEERRRDRVAVVGLGAMGSRMAARLIAAGFEVILWNRTAAKVDYLARRGGVAASTPADATRQADAVITIVSDPAALRHVTEGPGGIASGASRSTTVIQMGTVAPEAIERLASVLPEGSGLLDAPVLGSTSEAEEGKLSVFVGGTTPLASRWASLLSVLGTPRHVGGLGAGTAAKLVANAALLGTLALLGEALALARALDLDPDVAFDVLAATPLARQAERRRDAIASGHYPLRFSLALARKDADLIVEAASRRGADLRLEAAARTWLADAARAGRQDEDYSAVLEHILGRKRDE